MGLAVAASRRGEVDGVLHVGPLDCMPSRLVEAQLHHAAAEGLLSLTLSVNGDPIDPELLDGFAEQVKERFARRLARAGADAPVPRGRARSAAPAPGP